LRRCRLAHPAAVSLNVTAHTIFSISQFEEKSSSKHLYLFSEMASSSGSVTSAGRRGGQVGLSRPRAASSENEIARGGRAVANQQEIFRVRRAEHYAIPNENPIPNVAPPNSQQVANIQNLPNAEDALVLTDAEEEEEDHGLLQDDDGRDADVHLPGAAAPRPRRSRRPQWANNDARLNIMSRALLYGPHNYEVAANSSQRNADMEAVRNMKRIPSSSLAWDNLKHAGKTLILGKVSVDLSADRAYLEASGGAAITTELLRQKMNHFMALAVRDINLNLERPDPSNMFHLIVCCLVASPDHAIQMYRSGSTICVRSMRCSIIRCTLFFCATNNDPAHRNWLYNARLKLA
jgi:hypothetical protein